jgi:hypothetical protein
MIELSNEMSNLASINQQVKRSIQSVNYSQWERNKQQSQSQPTKKSKFKSEFNE